MKACVFIHTNHRQMIGALVSQYSIRRHSAHAEAFDVRIITPMTMRSCGRAKARTTSAAAAGGSG